MKGMGAPSTRNFMADPAPIHVHEEMNKDCGKVIKGTILRLFNAKCTNFLHTYKAPPPPTVFNPIAKKVPHAGSQSLLRTQELGKQIIVCEMDPIHKPFGKKGYIFRLNVRKLDKCKIRTIKADFSYSEAWGTGSAGDIMQSLELNWPDGATSRSFTMATNSIGDPFDFGSSGKAVALARVDIDDPDPESSCTHGNATVTVNLVSLGKLVDVYYGDPGPRIGSRTCELFTGGYGAAQFWTGGNFSQGSVGLLMNFYFNIYGTGF